jgi:hypothetical protein
MQRRRLFIFFSCAPRFVLFAGWMERTILIANRLEGRPRQRRKWHLFDVGVSYDLTTQVKTLESIEIFDVETL